MNLQIRSAILCCLLGSAVIGCGGGSSSSGGAAAVNTDYSSLNESEIAATVLKVATQAELESHIKNGLRLRSDAQLRTSVTAEFDVLAASSGQESAPAAQDSSNFSETNTIVEGVDEADYLKYDGSTIFVSSQPSWNWSDGRPESPRIRLLETNLNVPSATELSSISLDDEAWGAVGELYLVRPDNGAAQALATVRNSWSAYAAAEPAIDVVSDALFAPVGRDAAQVAVYDVSDPSNPALDWRFEVDGYLQETRKIGDVLYIVSHHFPYLPTLARVAASEDELEGNEIEIRDANLGSLLPNFRIDGGESSPITEIADCLVPVDLDENDGYASTTTIIAVDLSEREVVSGICLNTSVSGIHASMQSLYLGGSEWRPNGGSETVIHKFELNDGLVNYRSTGRVPGFISWGDQAAFRMSEHDGYFRVVTTIWEDGPIRREPEHHLTILRDNLDTDEMIEVAAIPNEARPEPIGKPGEDIFSVRFRGDEAFIVTFERVDPLYVLDLSDPNDPFLAGELEIPGFSTYLHPVNERYLLGFGRDVVDGQNQGLKISLFDIGDASNPVEVSNTVLGGVGSYSDALYDLHALSFLEVSDSQLRFTMPAVIREDYDWQNSGLHLFELNNKNLAAATLDYAGQILTEERTEGQLYPQSYGAARSILQGDAVFFSYHADIFSAFWNNPEAALGPQ